MLSPNAELNRRYVSQTTPAANSAT